LLSLQKQKGCLEEMEKNYEQIKGERRNREQIQKNEMTLCFAKLKEALACRCGEIQKDLTIETEKQVNFIQKKEEEVNRMKTKNDEFTE